MCCFYSLFVSISTTLDSLPRGFWPYVVYIGECQNTAQRAKLPKRRSRPLRSAPKPCLKVSLHTAPQECGRLLLIHSVVFGMPLIMTVSVKCTFVTEFFTSALAFWGDMINVYVILISEEKITPSAFSLLFL